MCENELHVFASFCFIKLRFFLNVILPMPYWLAGDAKAFCTKGKNHVWFSCAQEGQGVISNQSESLQKDERVSVSGTGFDKNYLRLPFKSRIFT